MGIKKSLSSFGFIVLLFTCTIAISSCSEDDGDGDCLPGIAELPADLIGTYSGPLTLNGTLVSSSGSATIASSGCKTYTVSFTGSVPSVTEVRFIQANNVYTFVGNNAANTVVIGADKKLTVSTTTPSVIAFTGSK